MGRCFASKTLVKKHLIAAMQRCGILWFIEMFLLYYSKSMLMNRLSSIISLVQRGSIAGGYALLFLLVTVHSLGFCARHHVHSCHATHHELADSCGHSCSTSERPGEVYLTTASCHCHPFHLHSAPLVEVPEQNNQRSLCQVSLAVDILTSEAFFLTPPLSASTCPSEEFRAPAVVERNTPLLS
jgi:hypothetical protein